MFTPSRSLSNQVLSLKKYCLPWRSSLAYLPASLDKTLLRKIHGEPIFVFGLTLWHLLTSNHKKAEG